MECEDAWIEGVANETQRGQAELKTFHFMCERFLTF